MNTKNILQNKIFKKREVVFITDSGIINKKISSFSIFCKNIIILFFILFTTLSVNLNLKQKIIIEDKELKIKNLEDINTNLAINLTNLDVVVSNMQYYFDLLNKYDRFASLSIDNISNDYKFVDVDDIKVEDYSKVALVLNKINYNLNNIEVSVNRRIDNLELLANEVGLDNSKLNNIHKVNLQKQEANQKITVKSNNNLINNFAAKVNYLSSLDKIPETLPSLEPMNSYRFTSYFGLRNHPFDKETKLHRGIDIAGPINSKIIAPSDGIIIFAGVKNGYGNYIKIDHGYNITTEYGHLKTFLVNKGDNVKRGDVIAIQGNTGRSTGDHLHYEVKIDNKPLNPKKFIDTGNKIF